MQTMAPHYYDWFRPLTMTVAGTLNCRANISREAAEDAARKKWHWVDCDIYGANQAKKNKKRVPRICLLGGQSKLRNWHYHFAAQVPAEFIARYPDWDETRYVPEFCAYLQQNWERFEEAGKFSVFEPIENEERWLKYICEEEGFGDGEFCVRTSFLGA